MMYDYSRLRTVSKNLTGRQSVTKNAVRKSCSSVRNVFANFSLPTLINGLIINMPVVQITVDRVVLTLMVTLQTCTHVERKRHSCFVSQMEEWWEVNQIIPIWKTDNSHSKYFCWSIAHCCVVERRLD